MRVPNSGIYIGCDNEGFCEAVLRIYQEASKITGARGTWTYWISKINNLKSIYIRPNWETSSFFCSRLKTIIKCCQLDPLWLSIILFMTLPIREQLDSVSRFCVVKSIIYGRIEKSPLYWSWFKNSRKRNMRGNDGGTMTARKNFAVFANKPCLTYVKR